MPESPDNAVCEPFRSRSLRPAGACLAVFLAAFVLYAATANRGAQWQDSGSQILRIVTGVPIHPLGLALSHPLHYALGRWAILPGLLEPCLAITLVSSVAAAVAVTCVFGCVRSFTRRMGPALFAAASLGVAQTFWRLATITEVYTLVAALLAAECWCLVLFCRDRKRGWLWGMLFFNGLGLANHLVASLTTPVLAVVAFQAMRKGAIRWRDLWLGGLLWLVATLPYSGLVVSQWLSTGDFYGTLKSALVGRRFAGDVLNVSLTPRVLAVSLLFPLYNFPNLLIPAAVYGLITKRVPAAPRTARRALLAGFLLHALFVIRYSVVDQYTFFLPTYVFLSLFGGLGAAATLEWDKPGWKRACWSLSLVLLLLTPVIYLIAPALARKYQVLERFVGPRNRPYRDEYQYLLTPWLVSERSAERVRREALQLAGPDGLILVEDSMAVFAVEYGKLRADFDNLTIGLWSGMPPDQRARFLETTRRYAEEARPVVLVPKNADRPLVEPPVGRWQRRGDLYLLSKKESNSS